MHYSHRLSQTRLHQIVGWFVLVPILVLVGVVVLVAQSEINVGHGSRPVVADGGHIESEEPFNIAEGVAEARPLVETVKKTRVRVEEVTQDLQATVQTGHEALKNVREASTRLPAILQNLKETTAALREATLSTTEQVPAIAASVRASVDRAADAMRDGKAATGRRPGVVDSLQGAVDNVKAVTEDVPPLLRSVEGTLQDVDEIVMGAKQTFPISTFAAKGRAARAEERTVPIPRSLRRDDLVKE